MGVSIKEHDAQKNHISIIQRIRVYFNVIYEAFHVQKGMEKLNADFNKIEKLFLDSYNENLNNEELVKLYNEIGDAVLKNWDITLLNDIYRLCVYRTFKKKTKKAWKTQTMRKKPIIIYLE